MICLHIYHYQDFVPWILPVRIEFHGNDDPGSNLMFGNLRLALFLMLHLGVSENKTICRFYPDQLLA